MMKTKTMEKKFDVKYILRISLILFIICALTALLLSVVNTLTEERIVANSQAKMNASISNLFGPGISSRDTGKEFQEPVKKIYEVHDANGSFLGYAVYAIPVGFKGDIEMMIGINTDGSVKNVEIISMSETPGLGTKVKDVAFIGQYAGITGNPALGSDIIPVAGATISSRTVNVAVNAAINAVGGIAE